jgi:hypothetical protein
MGTQKHDAIIVTFRKEIFDMSINYNSSMKSRQQQVAVITGSSSGIRFEASLLVARMGFIHMLPCVIKVNQRRFLLTQEKIISL